MSRESDIKRRAELKRFMKADVNELIVKLELQEVHRAQARAIHYQVLMSRHSSSIIDISGR